MFTFPNAPTHVASTVQNIPSKIVSVRTGFTSGFQSDGQTNVSAVTLGASDASNTADSQNTEWTLAAQPLSGQKVSYTTSWNGAGSGADVYSAFSGTGALPNGPIDASNSAGAIAVSAHLEAGKSTVIRFALAWDFPQIGFGPKQETVWMRRYTSFYGGQEDANNNYVAGSYAPHQGFAIADRNLSQRTQALNDVQQWWTPIATNEQIPESVRMAALNELNQLVFNSSFWESGLVRTSVSPAAGGPRIGSLIAGEHLFHTLTGGGWADAGEINVQGQASLAIQQLFPTLDQDWALALSQMVMQDPNGRVPDPGSTDASPWLQWSPSTGPASPGQPFFDTPIKYLSRAYALYKQTHDVALLKQIYPAMVTAWTKDVVPRIPTGATFPINPALFANTYDVLGEDPDSTGVYNAGLYILGLQIMIDATNNASALGIAQAKAVDVGALPSTLASAQTAYESMFWTGSYYKGFVAIRRLGQAEAIS